MCSSSALTGSLLYVNADTVLEAVLERVEAEKASGLKLVVCDLSASPLMDLAGSGMLLKLHAELAAQDIRLRVVGARSRVRDLLRGEKLDEKIGAIERGLSIGEVLRRHAAPGN